MKLVQFTIVAFLWATAVLGLAQDDSSKPAMPAATQPSLANTTGQEALQSETPQYEPDKVPLSGIHDITIGLLSSRRNTLNAGFSLSQYAQVFPATAGGYDTDYTSTFAGNLALELASVRHALTVNYAATGIANSSSSNTITSSHQLGFTESITGHRWTLMVSDALGYTPASPFGNGIYGALTTQAFNPLLNNPAYGSGLANYLIPNDTILSTLSSSFASSQLSNTVGAQLQYRFTPRTSVTVEGSYGVLRYLGGDLLDTNQYSAGFGLTRQLTARNSVGVTYLHGSYDVPNQPGSNSSHTDSAMVSFGRRLTGRLALQVSGGPQIWTGFSDQRVSWTMNSRLNYDRGRNAFSASYVVSAGGGSGVYSAARSHAVQGSLARQITPRWNTTIVSGFAHNSALLSSSSVNSYYAGFLVGRRFGRAASVQLQYNYQRQDLPSSCSGIECTIFGGSTHVFGLTLNWHFHPVRIG